MPRFAMIRLLVNTTGTGAPAGGGSILGAGLRRLALSWPLLTSSVTAADTTLPADVSPAALEALRSGEAMAG